jgi:HD-GYP domain-containing protein (c-di-GMP phosphodiesterase class II)
MAVHAETLGDSVETRLRALHQIAQNRFGFIDRIAMALYDPDVDLLKTFVSSNGHGDPLARYEAHLVDVPSLRDIARKRSARVVDDVAAGLPGTRVHGEWLRSQRYRSSYTLPVFQDEVLAAFLFFDSRQPAAFTPEVTAFLDLFAELAAQVYLLRLSAVRTLIGAVNLACGLAGQRDSETGWHLRRIGLFSRLIAHQLAPTLGLSDEYIDYIHLFAPLHDIGKVGIPDRILLKAGRLTPEEVTQMRSHVELGVEMVDHMIDDLGLGDDSAAQIMRNIVSGHHERCDGSGYPQGLKDEQISLEARIVAVADVYDALSVERHYKPAWLPDDYAAELRRQAAAGMLDSACVEALLDNPSACAEIRTRFADPHAHGLHNPLRVSHADVLGQASSSAAASRPA